MGSGVEKRAPTPLVLALAELARAVVLALGLTLLLPALALLGLARGVPPTWDPRLPSIAWQLTCDAAEAPGLRDELAVGLGPEAALELEVSGSEVWLVLAAPDGSDVGARVAGALRERGAWGGTLRTESGFARVLALSLEDPGRAAGALPLLLPWMFVSTGLAFLLVALRGRRRWPEPRIERASAPGRTVLAGLATGLLLLLTSEAASRLLVLVGFEPAEQELVTAVAAAGGAPFALLALSAVGLAPLAEELFFRGHLYRLLTAAPGPAWRAHALTALLFASIHLNPAALPVYALYSVVLSLAYARTRSLAVVVIAHAVVNATGMALLARGS